MKKILLIIPFVYFASCNTSETSKSKLDANQDVIEKINEKETQLPDNTIQQKVIPAIPDEPKIKNEVIKIASEKIILPEKENITAVEKNNISEKVDVIPPKKTATQNIDNTVTTIKETVVKETIQEIKEPVVLKANHTAWDKLTKMYVSTNGKVNYKGFKSKIASIESYLLHLQNTTPTKKWSRNEKLAYWFNLYNASTIHLVASNYPVKSIKDINSGKPWDKKFIKSGSNVYSLNDIENTIVRPNYNEPRLHVAFNCAAISCPNLFNNAFSPTSLNSQLNSLSKKWINDSTKNEIKEDTVEISQIFNWYKVDFKEGVIPFLNKYSTVKANSNTSINYKEYNWSLNE